MFKKSTLAVFLACVTSGTPTYAFEQALTPTPLPKEASSKDRQFIEALAEAYQNNPDIHVGLREYYAAVEAIPVARAGWLPTITLRGSGEHQKALSNGKSTAIQPVRRGRSNTATDTLSLQTTVQQNLFKGGQTSYAVAKAKADVSAAHMKFVGVEQNVLLSAVRAYLDLWKAYEILRYREASVSFRERIVAQVKAQEDVGEKTRTDVAEARSQLAAAVAVRLTAESALVTAQATYAQVIGANVPESLKKPAFILPKEQLPKTLEILNALALKEAPGLQQAIFAEKAQRAAVGVSEGTLLPSVDLSATGSRQKSNTQTNSAFHEGATAKQTGFGYTNTGTVGVSITVPLYQAGTAWSGVRRANQQRYQALNAVKQARLELLRTARSTLQSVISLEDSIKQTELQIEAAQLSLEGKRQEYLVGEQTLTDTLIAEQRLVDAQVQLVERERDYQVAVYQLISVYGGLLPEQLGLPVARHNVALYTDEISTKLIGTGDLRAPESIDVKE
ncbi:MAG: TolC family outer membrane protein [Alphaproteobacteria bacterium]|nr:TolC family outer membrane protein [Alphaproteobacteria bacterium]NCQ66494.1 TolC family outer membrane protein [Alphaproteobacteria bacterium]NCT08285.1 TolC family outer membrane protein [Alphaproteobacteria bacterium]